MQRSSKSVKSNFRARMRATKDGRLTAKDHVNEMASWVVRLVIGVPVIIFGFAIVAWLFVNIPFLPLGLIVIFIASMFQK